MLRSCAWNRLISSKGLRHDADQGRPGTEPGQLPFRAGRHPGRGRPDHRHHRARQRNGGGHAGRRRHRPAGHPRVGERSQPRADQPVEGHGRPLDARDPARQRTLDRWPPLGRGEIPVGRDRRLRDAAQGLYCLVRHVRRVPAADHRRRERGGAGLRRCRHPRDAGADDGRPQLLRGDPRAGRCTARPAARTGPRHQACPACAERRRLPRTVHELEVRPQPDPPGARPDHPAPLQR